MNSIPGRPVDTVAETVRLPGGQGAGGAAHTQIPAGLVHLVQLAGGQTVQEDLGPGK